MKVTARRLLLLMISIVAIEIGYNGARYGGMTTKFLFRSDDIFLNMTKTGSTDKIGSADQSGSADWTGSADRTGSTERTGSAESWEGQRIRTSGKQTTSKAGSKTSHTFNLGNIQSSSSSLEADQQLKASDKKSSIEGHLKRTKDSRISSQNKRIITVVYPLGRLGNQLFIYASLIGVALSRGLDPQLFGSACTTLSRTFISTLPCNESLSKIARNLVHFRNAKAAVYDRQVEEISNSSDKKPVAMVGYMQSWRYFHEYRPQLMKHLIFKNSVLKARERFISKEFKQIAKLRPSHVQPVMDRRDCILIGVHVRRTDMTTANSHNLGYTEAPKEYIWKAMDKMEQLLKNHTTPIVYLVASDDIHWCKSVIRSSNRTVMYSEEGHENLDLALLAGCDHVIITTGTYGWWGAYLAGGITIYYSRYPRANTYVGGLTNTTDYYPPEWKPLP